MMNGDDPQHNAHPRRVPPPARPGPPPMRRPGPRPNPAGQPPGAAPPPPGPREPTQVLRRDGRQAPPLAYSQVPPQQAPPQPPPRRRPPPPPKPAPTHAPTQQPVPYREDPPPARRRPPPGPPPPDGGRRRAPRPEPAPRRRRKRHPFRWLLVLLLLLVLAIAGGVVQLDSSLNRIPALANYSERVGDTPGTNWLLVGADGRSDLSEEQTQELATGGDIGSERTDTILLIHVPSSGGKTTMVSLPRDSYVNIPGQGKDKLNAAFAIGGAQLLAQTVEIATGIHLDHYAQIGFGGFAGIVDSLGGIDICVPEPMDDPMAGINLSPGCQTLNGPQALGFVRSRATAMADVDRMNHQRLFMAALLKKMTGAGTWANPFTLWPVATKTVKSLKVDQSDHVWHLAMLAWAMRGETVATTVPIGGFEDNDSGNVLLWDTDRASQFFDALAKDQQIPDDLLTQ